MERPSKPDLLSFDFNERPFTIAWELTRSCALACVHCRASAQPKRHPGELDTAEARRLLDEIADLHPAVLVLTGGHPMMRPDLFEIVEYAVGLGLRVSVSPTATALTTRDRLQRLRDLGVAMVHVSLDGATAATHDAFRGFAGTYDRSLRILADLRALGVPAQVGTTITRRNAAELPALSDVMATAGVQMWNLFFVVPTGRAKVTDVIDVETAERTWEWMCDLEAAAPFNIRTTAAPQYRRTMLRRRRTSGRPVRMAGAGYQIQNAAQGAQTRGVNDGKGFLFIDHLGNLCPSGFLQLPAGSVREQRVADVYQQAPLFRSLRDPSLLTGRCGACRYTELCSGSRARAYGTTGSYLADDPLCGLDHAAIRPPPLT